MQVHQVSHERCCVRSYNKKNGIADVAGCCYKTVAHKMQEHQVSHEWCCMCSYNKKHVAAAAAAS